MTTKGKRNVSGDEKAKRLELVKRCAVDNFTAAEIAYRIGLSLGGTKAFLKRNKIHLAAKKRRGPVPSQPNRPRVTAFKSNPAAPTRTFALVTHVVSERHTQAKPKQPMTCMWIGCAQPSIAVGKPYCSHHHVKSGGMFCS